MRYHKVFFYVSLSVLLLFIFSCMASQNSLPETELSFDLIATGQQCPPAPKIWRATWIRSQEEFRQLMLRCRSNRMTSSGKETPFVNFKKFGVLALEMGQRNSAGYGFDTAKIEAYLKGQTAIIRLVYLRPAADTLTAQVMTSPWIMIRLPTGLFRNIRILDQRSRVLAQIESL
jgi:hypothetical protein